MRLLIASQGKVHYDAKECKRALSSLPGKKGWMKEFLEIHKDPECTGMDFDLCIEWARAFYFLTPITNMAYLTTLCALGLNAFDDLVALHTNGLMGCSCGCFFCTESCASTLSSFRVRPQQKNNNELSTDNASGYSEGQPRPPLHKRPCDIARVRRRRRAGRRRCFAVPGIRVNSFTE